MASEQSYSRVLADYRRASALQQEQPEQPEQQKRQRVGPDKQAAASEKRGSQIGIGISNGDAGGQNVISTGKSDPLFFRKPVTSCHRTARQQARLQLQVM